jgi:hypothetical protein
LRSHQIVEIHLSHNQGIADTYDLIPVDIWFDRYISDWQARYFVTYESLPISLVTQVASCSFLERERDEGRGARGETSNL